MATQHKTASGVPRPEATDVIDVVDIQGIADKVEDTIQNIDLTKIVFSNNPELRAVYNAMRDGEVRVVYAWNVTAAQGWPLDRSTGNLCLLVKVNDNYGLAIANSGHIGQWYSTGSEFVWR